MTDPIRGVASPELPEGTIVFFRSDVEGSMRLVRSLGSAYDEWNERHLLIVRGAVDHHRGLVVRTEGDAVFAVFTDAMAAARAAVDSQRELAAQDWPEGGALRVRIGLHAGTAHRAGDDYGGFEVNRAARIAAIGWGCQIVLSDPARALIAGELPEGWAIRDLGPQRLAGVEKPEPLYQLDAPGLESEFPPLGHPADAAGNLPARASTFIGREDELETLGELLARSRLLTLTGVGGIGKTSLALELARRHAADFPDAAWFVDLQALRDPSLVRAETAYGLGLHDGTAGSAADRLLDFVAERQLLVVLDNFEQVIGAAGVVSELLRASPGSRVIVTSRVPLRLRSEQEYRVRALSLPEGDGSRSSEAVRLFLDRAHHVRPELHLAEPDLEIVERICRLVDGLPLAIELCAARVSALPPRVILERLAKRLPLPGPGPRDLPERQRTMEDTLAWSYDLLEPPLQRLLARLAVFAGSFDLEQAEEVCGASERDGSDVLEGLVELVEQSLLLRMEDDGDGLRFGMLEVVRAYAQERLAASGEEPDLKERHARAYGALAERAAAFMPGREHRPWVDRLERDEANLRTAATWAIEARDADLAIRCAALPWRFWFATGRMREGRELMGRALDLPGADTPGPLRLKALDAAGGVAYWSGDIGRADACYSEQLRLASEMEDARGQADANYNLAFTRRILGDLAGAKAAEGRAAELFARLGDPEALARLAWSRLITSWAEGPEGDGDPMPEVIARFEALGDEGYRETAESLRAQHLMLSGRASQAVAPAIAGVRRSLVDREFAQATVGLQPFIVILARAGRYEESAVALGALYYAWERYGIRPPATFEMLTGVTDPAEAIVASIGEERFEAALERGRRWSPDEALDYLETVLDSIPADELDAASLRINSRI